MIFYCKSKAHTPCIHTNTQTAYAQCTASHKLHMWAYDQQSVTLINEFSVRKCDSFCLPETYKLFMWVFSKGVKTSTVPHDHHYPGHQCFKWDCVCLLLHIFESLLLPNCLRVIMFLCMPQLYCVHAVGRQFHVWGMPPTFIHLHSL